MQMRHVSDIDFIVCLGWWRWQNRWFSLPTVYLPKLGMSDRCVEHFFLPKFLFVQKNPCRFSNVFFSLIFIFFCNNIELLFLFRYRLDWYWFVVYEGRAKRRVENLQVRHDSEQNFFLHDIPFTYRNRRTQFYCISTLNNCEHSFYTVFLFLKPNGS
jgi:hypothetical protein